MKKIFILLIILVMTCFLTISANATPIFNPITGHYYEAIYVAPGGSGITWDYAKAAAESLLYNGWRGYLATVTSQSENDFLLSTFGDSATLHGYWLGGFQPASSTEPDGNWQWVTGEAWSYTNWQPGEPNNYYMGEWGGPPEGSSENALHYQYANNPGHLAWNDFPDSAYGIGYIVEYAPEPTVECVLPPSGLISWWPADGNTSDIVDANHGTLQGGTSYGTGLVVQAFSFDGIDDFVQVPDSDLWAFTDDFTIEMWVNFNSPPGGTLIHPGAIFVSNTEGGGELNKWSFELGDNKLAFHINGPPPYPDNGYFLAQADFSPTLHQWYHLAVTRSGNVYTIYINGTPAGNETNDVVIPNPNAPLTIGQGEGFFLDGLMDEVAIYNRALSPTEIASIYNASRAGKCKNQRINLPKTGQTKCYDTAGTEIPCAGTGQDGEIQAGVVWPEPRFTDNLDGTITDNLTGLIWTQYAGTPTVGACAGGTMNWQQALDYVVCLNSNNYLGHDDWTLPNINELDSLVDANRSNPALALGHPFLSVQNSWYWSNTTDRRLPQNARVLGMFNGDAAYRDKSYADTYAWLVRSGHSGTANVYKTGQTTCYNSSGSAISCSDTGQDGDIQAGVTWPNPRFTDNGDQAIKDNLTGLVWAKNANLPGSNKTWQQALDYVEGMNFGTYPNMGFTDWRLPNRKELLSLIDNNNYEPALPQGHPFTNVQNSCYWSNTTEMYSSGTQATCVFMDYGRLFNYGKGSQFYLLPVRGGTIVDTTPPVTTASPAGATYSSPQNVTLTCDDTGSAGCQTTYYCLGAGCNPTAVYSGAINISSSTTLRFYSKDNANNSESMKTEVYTINNLPLVECNIVPDTTTIHRGGTFGFQATATNNTNAVQVFKFATRIIKPDGGKYPPTGYLLGPATVGLGPSESISRRFTQYIPNYAPLGTYTYRGYVGVLSNIYDECQFQFTVTEQGQSCTSCHQ